MRFRSINATTNSDSIQITQYLCSRCHTVLKETAVSEEEIQSSISYFSKREECPKCGSLLSEHLKRERKRRQLSQDTDAGYNNTTITELQREGQPLLSLPPKFQSAYDKLEINNRLTLDIRSIDPSSLDLTTGEYVCIVGQAWFTNLLISRLCIRALLSNRYGGFDSSHVIIIDAGGNNSDPYQCVKFARQYGLDIKKVLQSIIVSRAFTIYQLANLIVNELPKVIKKFDDDVKLIIIANLLGMFVNDPQIEIEEAEFIIDEIITSIRKQVSLSNLLFVIALNTDDSNDNNNSSHKFANYNKRIIRRFSKCIKISRDNQSNNDNNNLIIGLGTHNQPIHRHHHHTAKKFLIKERDLKIVIPS